MSPPRTATASVDTSLAQIEALGERMDRQFNEIKEMLLRYDERLRRLETREAACSPLIGSKLDAAWRKIDNHEAEMASMRKNVADMAKVVDRLESVAKWLLGIFTALIVSLVIAFLTGKIDILIK